jgi:hypothetical protein
MKKLVWTTLLVLVSTVAAALRNGCVPGTTGCGSCIRSPQDPNCQPSALTNGYADLNLDGHTDILWWDQTFFNVKVWMMNGLVRSGDPTFLSPKKVSGTNWRAVATGRFNPYDDTDIVWQNDTTGEVRIWLMAGTTELFEVPIACPPGGTPPSPSWKIAAAGYFGKPFAPGQRDGMTDLLFRNEDTGAMHFWLLDGTTARQEIALPQSATVLDDSAWRVEGAGFFDEAFDPWSDLVWYNRRTGRILVWRMNGTALDTEILLTATQTDTNWRLIGTGNFHGDPTAYPELLCRNYQTGELRVWSFDGTVDHIQSIRVEATSPDGRSDPTWKPLAK